MKIENQKIIVQLCVVWIAAVVTLSYFWDSWFLPGPHGTYRWVGMDLVPFWVGVQAMLHGLNPYTPEVTLKIQEVLYGGPAGNYDPMMFVYPAWLFAVILPLSLLPLKGATILYSSILIVSLYLVVKQQVMIWAGGRKEGLFLFSAWLGALPFLLISAVKGQLGYLSLLGLYAAHRLSAKRPLLAGIALGFALIKPMVAAFPVLAFLSWSFYRKEWTLVMSFLACMLFLSLTSFLAVGFWIPEYLAMLRITGGMPVLWSVRVLAPPWNCVYGVYLVGLAGYGLIRAVRSGRFRPLFSAAVLLGIGLIPMRWIYDLFWGILIPNDEPKLSLASQLSVSLAMLSPWTLLGLDETLRGSFAAIAIPLLWSFVFLVENSGGGYRNGR